MTDDPSAPLRPVVLVVEDNERGLTRRAGLLADAGCTPIPARSRDEALRELRASPGVDLVLTDIHLLDHIGDRSGVELARAARGLDEHLPIAGYSAHFSEPSELGADLELFTRTWIKGRMTWRDIQKTIDECRELASAHRRQRVRSYLASLEKLRRGEEKARPEVQLLRELTPGAGDAESVERKLSDAGYRLKFVDAEQSGLGTPIIVWLLRTADVIEAEVYGHPALYADGPDDESAIVSLIELMRLYWIDMEEEPERLAGPALDLKRFLDRVFVRVEP